jgi:hypothetical protein
MKSLGKGWLGGSERIMGIFIISYGKNSLDLRPTWVTTSPRERIEFVSQGSTALLTCAWDGSEWPSSYSVAWLLYLVVYVIVSVEV